MAQSLKDTPFPKKLLSTKEEIEPYLLYYFAPRFKHISESLQLLQYAAGMIHMLDMLCVVDSEAEKDVKSLKKLIGEMINNKTKLNFSIYAAISNEHDLIKNDELPQMDRSPS